MRAEINSAIDLLRKKLVGEFISRFSVGDTWDLYFNDFWLLAQEVIPEDETLMSQFLEDNTRWYKGAVDKEQIARSAFVAACMRKEIKEVELDQLCNLLLRFEDDSVLMLPTNVDIVDWQWCLNKTGADPYSEYLVACFWAGEIEVAEDEWIS